jgi:MoaA/NifB/PqqE/SkfB family radical SAM enzyme
MRNIPKKAGILDYSVCNAKCNHCNRGALNDLDDSISEKEVLDNLEALKSQDITTFSFSGGEPTLNPSLDKFIGCITDDSNSKNIVRISTNGSWGDNAKEKLIRYYELGVKKIGLSLDGFEKTHDSIRGFPGLYEKVMKIIEATSIFKEQKIKIPLVKLHITAQPKNIDELEDLAEEFTDKGFPIGLTFVTRYGRAWNMELNEDQVNKINSVRKKLKMEELDIKGLYKSSFEEFKKRPHCSCYEKGFERVFMSSDGSIFLCPHYFTPYAMTIGNVKEKRLDLILEKFKRGGKKDFYHLFIDPSGEKEKRSFLEELDTSRYDGIRWSKKCIPCSILSSFVYFRKQGYSIDEANDLTEKIAKGKKI